MDRNLEPFQMQSVYVLTCVHYRNAFHVHTHSNTSALMSCTKSRHLTSLSRTVNAYICIYSQQIVCSYKRNRSREQLPEFKLRRHSWSYKMRIEENVRDWLKIGKNINILSFKFGAFYFEFLRLMNLSLITNTA